MSSSVQSDGRESVKNTGNQMFILIKTFMKDKKSKAQLYMLHDDISEFLED